MLAIFIFTDMLFIIGATKPRRLMWSPLAWLEEVVVTNLQIPRSISPMTH